MTKEKFNALINALTEAENSAMMLSEVEDSGSCNFDQAMIKVSLTEVQRQEVEYILEPVKSFFGYGRGWYWVNTSLHGQANRRTAMARAALNSLKGAGYDVRMHYQVD